MESPQGFTEEINFHDLEMIQVVGEGAFGVVSKARLRGKVVAVKLIQTESERKAFLTELKQLSRVNHPNIVKLYGACTSPRVCLVMEYAEGGSLYNVLHVHGANRQEAHYKAAHAVSWLLQCARGVEYLHSMKPKALIHRDLKPPNLLLVTGGTMLKICDFGTACDAQTHMTNNKGSAAWMAPEVFEGCNYSEKCDVFSFGIILWEVFTRRKPFDEIGGPAFRIMWAVHNGTRPPLIKDLPKPLELLMTRCWSANAAERPSMSEVVRIMSRVFQFFKGADEPLKYINGATDSDEYNPVPSTMGAWSQASGGETQPITGESRGGTMTKTIRHAAGEPVSVLPPTPMQPVFTPPVVLEDESPRGGISCPPSLAASLESLDKPSSRSGTPVNPFKRHSTDLSILDEYDTVGQGNAAPKNLAPAKGHRRSGSYGTPGMYTPVVNNFLAPPTPGHLFPGKHHNRTGSDESCRVSPGDPTPQSSRASPARTGTSPSGPTRLPHVHSYPVIDRQSSAMTTGPIQATEPSVNGQHLAAANRSISWAPGATTANTVPVVNGLPCNTTDASVMNMVYLSLDHQLQPLEPAPNSKESLEIFRQHCQLAEQYLKVQTEIALLMQRKHELINEYEQGEKKGEQSSNQIAHEYFQLRTENDSLSTLRNNLEKQVAHIRRQQQQRKITT